MPLPFRVTPGHDTFEGSRQVTTKRFLNLERKLQSNPDLYNAYRHFMKQYIDLGNISMASRPGSNFIPHHAVLKDSADISNLRVVFDATAPCYSGISLNNCLLTGAKFQADMVDILVGFRSFRYVFTADV